jgi:hypothetical protein
MTSVSKLCVYSECRYTECRYAECRYAECRYGECHGAACVYQVVIAMCDDYGQDHPLMIKTRDTSPATFSFVPNFIKRF